MSPSLLAQASFAFQSGKPVTAVMRCSSSADGGFGPLMTALGEPALPLASEIRSARSRSDSGAGGGRSSTCGSGSGAATAGSSSWRCTGRCLVLSALFTWCIVARLTQ